MVQSKTLILLEMLYGLIWHNLFIRFSQLRNSYMNQEFASDAHIFSFNQMGEDTASDLLYAQMVVEAKWLGDFPVFAFPTLADEIKRFAPLYEDVKLVYPDN